MDKQEIRQAEMDARHQDTITFRNTAREEDKEWRQTIREEDKEWRQAMRAEDKAWRVQIRNEDNDYRARAERTAKRSCALSAAAQTLQPGTPPEEVFALARKYVDWLDSQKD